MRKARLRRSRGGMPRASSGASTLDRKSTRLNSSHSQISYAVFCLKKKIKTLAEVGGEYRALAQAVGAVVDHVVWQVPGQRSRTYLSWKRLDRRGVANRDIGGLVIA